MTSGGPLVMIPYPTQTVDMGQYLSRQKEAGRPRAPVDRLHQRAGARGRPRSRPAGHRGRDRRASLRHGHTGRRRRLSPCARGVEGAAAGLADRHRRRLGRSRPEALARSAQPAGASLLTVVATARRQADLFPAEPAMPEGFVYREEVISADEERHFADRFALLPFAPFNSTASRGAGGSCRSAGATTMRGRQIRSSAPICPSFSCRRAQRAATVAELAAEACSRSWSPNMRRERRSAGIATSRFHDVIAISFLSPCLLRFRRRARRLGTALARRDAEIRLSAPRRAPHGVGAQHPAGRARCAIR